MIWKTLHTINVLYPEYIVFPPRQIKSTSSLWLSLIMELLTCRELFWSQESMQLLDEDYPTLIYENSVLIGFKSKYICNYLS